MIKNRILDIPDRISGAPNAIELVRIWANGKQVWITLNTPASWREVDLAELVCNTLLVTANVMAPRTGLDEKTYAQAAYQTLFDPTQTEEQIEEFYEQSVREDVGHPQKPEVRQAVKENMAVIPLTDPEEQDAIEVMRIWHLGSKLDVTFRAGSFEDIGNCVTILKSLVIYMANVLYQRGLSSAAAKAEADLRLAIATRWQQVRQPVEA